MIVLPLSLERMETIRKWRILIPETLRTSYALTGEMQKNFYYEVICDRYGTTRYWAFEEDDLFIGMGGVENIQFENSIGEISIIVNPDHRGMGYGRKIVDEILNQAFNHLNIETVWGECYTCGNIEFWIKIIKEKEAFHTILPKRKYYNGKYWDSLYFTFFKHADCEIK